MIIMEVVNMIDTKNMNLSELSTATRENLESLGYGPGTIQMVNRIWQDLSQFLGGRGETPFQPVYGLEYLHERIGYPECLYRKLTPNERDYIRAVRMLERLRIRDFSPGLIREYLSWLEHDRGCGISTRNQRLAALRSFFKYVSVEAPENMLLCQKIVNIPYAKKEQAAVCYLTTEEMAKLLRQPDQSSSIGRRDLCFLSLLYDTGARVSEILSLKVRDVHLSTPAKVILYGKGRKLREVPILPNTALHLQQYLTEHKLSAPEKLDRTLFVNRQGNPLTRAGATYILNKYVQMAELDTHVSPHILRHTKAMHLLEAGINIFYIKDLLGHEDISTTEVYAKASIETQRRALEKHSLVMPPATPSWVTNTDTLEWLKALGK
jgi:integrase family protein